MPPPRPLPWLPPPPPAAPPLRPSLCLGLRRQPRLLLCRSFRRGLGRKRASSSASSLASASATSGTSSPPWLGLGLSCKPGLLLRLSLGLSRQPCLFFSRGLGRGLRRQTRSSSAFAWPPPRPPAAPPLRSFAGLRLRPPLPRLWHRRGLGRRSVPPPRPLLAAAPPPPAAPPLRPSLCLGLRRQPRLLLCRLSPRPQPQDAPPLRRFGLGLSCKRASSSALALASAASRASSSALAWRASAAGAPPLQPSPWRPPPPPAVPLLPRLPSPLQPPAAPFLSFARRGLGS